MAKPLDSKEIESSQRPVSRTERSFGRVSFANGGVLTLEDSFDVHRISNF